MTHCYLRLGLVTGIRQWRSLWLNMSLFITLDIVPIDWQKGHIFEHFTQTYANGLQTPVIFAYTPTT